MAAGTPPVDPSRVYLETYGCTTNEGDSRTMAGILAAAGHTLVDSADDADVVVVNTCTVIDTTETRMGNRLRDLADSGKRIIAAGCMAAAQPDDVTSLAPDAALIAPRNLHQIDRLVAGQDITPDYAPKTRLPRTIGSADAIIQVSEGCLFSCSYCLTKHARGDQSSYPIDALVADVRDAVNAGAVDIKLTSQDTSGFGWDQGTDLPALVRRITDIGGDFKLRIGMMHPRTAYRTLDDLLDSMDHPKVYKFLHLPIQTGSPRVLKAMNRGHPMEEFWGVVDAFRARFPEGVVSTDIIVAFPGETDDDHQMTLDLLRRLRAEHVNITRFSARPGTPAKAMEGRITTQVAKARSREVTELCWRMWDEQNPARIGDEVELYVVEEGKKPGTVLARGPGYQPVAIAQPSSEIPLGAKLTGRITEAHTTYFVAEPISEPVVVSKAAGRKPTLPVLPVVG